MAGPVKLGEFIADYQEILKLKPVANGPDPEQQAHVNFDFWIGTYDTGRRHLVEVIGPDEFPVFAQQLLEGDHTHRSSPGPKVNSILIFAEACCGSKQLLDKLRQYNACAFSSTQPARLILHTLSNALAQLGISQSYHGVALTVFGHGILLSGASGLGKSGIALELVSRGHILIADDLPMLARMPENKSVFAVCPPMLCGLLEVRALGILDVIKLFGISSSSPLCRLELVIELVSEYTPDAENRFTPYRQTSNILDVDIPVVQLPVKHVTNKAVLVETLVKNHVLYTAGEDANLDLILRQRNLLEKQTL